MSVNYSATAKTKRLQVSADLINGKTIAAATGSATNGNLIIGTSALSGATGVLATIALANADVVVSGSTMTVVNGASPKSATASAGGTAALAEIRDNAGNVIVSGLTVGTSGTDIVLNSATISASQTVTVSSGTVTHP